MRRVRAALARLVDARSRGASLVLVFDYDGTLAPFAEHPSLAGLDSATRLRLEELARTPSVFVGVASGRAIDDLRNRVGVEHAYYAGTSGLEISFGSTAIVEPDRARVVPLVAAAVMPLRRAIAGHAGVWLEEKPLGLTVHYRGARPGHLEALQADVACALEPLSGRWRVVDGAMAIEITPDLGWTKGTALRRIIDDVRHTPVLPLYAGDEANDAEALKAAADLGGVSIGIGPRAPSVAQYRSHSAWSLGIILDVLIEMLVGSGTAQSRRSHAWRPCS